MNLNRVFITLGAFLIASCSHDRGVKETVSTKEVLLYERSSPQAVILSEPINEVCEDSFRSDYKSTSCIGRCYLPEKGLFGEPNCSGRSVFDIDKFIRSFPQKVRKDKNPIRLEEKSYAYSSTESFNRKFSEKNDFSTSMKENIKLFEVGTSSSFEKAFDQEQSYTANSVYGIQSIYVPKYKYWLETSSGGNDMLLADGYFTSAFLRELYNTPLKELFASNSKDYSDWVIVGYQTGGRVDFLYKATSKNNMSSEEREQALKAAMNASCKLKSFGGSLDASISLSQKESETINSTFSEAYFSNKFIGGKIEASGYSAPSEIKTLSVNLSSWIQSLENEENQVFMNLLSGEWGIYPLYKFIREKNLRNRIKDRQFGNYQKPKFEIAWGALTGTINLATVPKKPYPIYVSLITRFGDNILLRPINQKDERYWSAQTGKEFVTKANQIAETLSQSMDIDIVRVDRISHPRSLDDFKSKNLFRKGEVLPLEPFISNSYVNKVEAYDLLHQKLNAVRCYHPTYGHPGKSKVQYLLFTGISGEKYALCIYAPYIISTYGLDKIYNAARVVDYNMVDFDEYTVIAL